MNKIDDAVIDAFDQAMERYMTVEFKSNWRTMCHQAAKISTRALQMLFPQQPVIMQRVEMIAAMRGAPGFIHLGYPDDPARPGKIPAHFAVTVGAGLYDPTFAQLKNASTPLDLPNTPYFFLRGLLNQEPRDFHTEKGFHWASFPAKAKGLLLVGYKVQPRPLPEEFQSLLMPDGLARRHARRVADLYRG